MSNCSMCRRPYERVNDDKLENGAPICPECSARFDTVLNSSDADEVRAAVNYIYSCSVQAEDEGVKECLDSFLENNASAADIIEAEALRRKNTDPVDVDKNDYFRDRSFFCGLMGTGEPGICKVLFISALVIMALGLIAGILFASNADYFGFWVFVSIAGGAAFAGLVLIGLAYIIGYLACIAHNSGGEED